MKYPVCKTCGEEMNIFDGVFWYTCPHCGDAVKITEDGKVTWRNEIFKQGSRHHNSDYELADFCRGGDLSED